LDLQGLLEKVFLRFGITCVSYDFTESGAEGPALKGLLKAI